MQKKPFMQYLNAITLLALIIYFITVSSGYAAEETRARWIGIDQLSKVIEEQNPVIVDLRTPAEFERGRIPGALNIPVDNLRENRTLLDAYKNRPVLLYCRTVNRTERALWILEGREFKSIYALKGGYEAYRAQDR